MPVSDVCCLSVDSCLCQSVCVSDVCVCVCVSVSGKLDKASRGRHLTVSTSSSAGGGGTQTRMHPTPADPTAADSGSPLSLNISQSASRCQLAPITSSSTGRRGLVGESRRELHTSSADVPIAPASAVQLPARGGSKPRATARAAATSSLVVSATVACVAVSMLLAPAVADVSGTKELETGFILRWLLTAESLTCTLTINRAVWISFGSTRTRSMLNSLVVVALPDASYVDYYRTSSVDQNIFPTVVRAMIARATTLAIQVDAHKIP
jgi:hypothetical protein